MRELEAFVSIAQVAVGVDMQDAELPVAVTQGTDQSVGRRMVAPDQSHGLPCVEPPRRLRPNVGVHGAAAFVDAAHLAYRIVVLGTSPPSRWAITFSASLRKRCDSSSNA